MLDPQAMTEFQKIYKQKREEYLDASIGETHDVRVLLDAIKRLTIDQEDFDRVIQNAWDSLRMDADLADALNRQLVEEAEARAKAAKSDKKQGDIDGQTKLVIDDGSLAVPASEVVEFNVQTAIIEIEQLQTSLGLDDALIGDLFNASGFDGMKTPEEQPEVYKMVVNALLAVEAFDDDLSLAAERAKKCSPEILVAVREFLQKDDAESARAMLVHHFTEIVEAPEPALDAGSVLFYCREDERNEPDPLIDKEIIVKYARKLLASMREQPKAPEQALEVLPTAPVDLPWEDLLIPEAEHKKIVDHFVEGESALGVVILDGLIGAQFAEHSNQVQGLILEKQVARFEALADQVAGARPAPEPEEPLNDLEKAAAKKKAAAQKKAATAKK